MTETTAATVRFTVRGLLERNDIVRALNLPKLESDKYYVKNGLNIFLKVNENTDGGSGLSLGLKEQLNQVFEDCKKEKIGRINIKVMDLAVLDIKFDPFYRLLEELLVQWDPKAVPYVTDNTKTMLQWDPLVNLIVNETCWLPQPLSIPDLIVSLFQLKKLSSVELALE